MSWESGGGTERENNKRDILIEGYYGIREKPGAREMPPKPQG